MAPIAPVTCPEIRRLARAECLAVLRRNSVGRLAFAFARQVEVLPVHYVVEDGWLYGRTSPGCTMDVWRRNHWVALEVDEMRAPVDWTSVVAYGALYLLRPDAARAEAATWQRAVELLRRLMPGTGSAYDPVPHRSLVFRMRAREVHGRATAPPPA